MSYLFPPPAPPSVEIHGLAERFPVHRIYCVGRNYAAHAREMGADPDREPPFFFTKPADAIVPVVPPSVGRVGYPLATNNYHHEIELVVAIGGSGVKIAAEAAQKLVWGYAVGLDMTRRDLQSDMREKKRPWDIGKSFAQAAPIGPLHPVSAVGQLSRGRIWLDVNGTRRQEGDLVFTGTPAGVGAVVTGDRLDGGIDGLGTLSVSVGPPLG